MMNRIDLAARLWRRSRSRRAAVGTLATVLAGMLLGCCLWGPLSPRAAAAATDGVFQVTANPGGGAILSGTLGQATLPAATAVLLRRLHSELGTRPTVVQTAQDTRDHSLALLFTSAHDGRPYTGVAIVTASPGAQAAGVALYDTTSRFHTSVNAMLQRLGQMTGAPAKSPAAPLALAPAEALVPHTFADGTGSISVPADWTVHVAGGGSAAASAPGNAAMVAYNMHFGGLDPSNPQAQMWLRTATPLARQNFHGAVLKYTGDPVASWTAMYEALGKQNGLETKITITRSTKSGSSADFAGTLGSGAKAIRFIAHAFVLPPNPMGMWQLSDSHIFVTQSQIPREANTANAVLDSVRINFGAVDAQQNAIRQMFQKQFEADIANDQVQDAQRQHQTDMALANDRAAQEGMHKQAVAMENYSLDRAVVVNTTTGRHDTYESSFADTLVHDNPNYQKVPAAGLLRGVDF